jgi:hypothetical protein
MRTILSILAILSITAGTAASQPSKKRLPDPDVVAIKAAALDYIEGWYEGSVDRMTRAVHPELVKRIVHTDDKGISRIDQMGASRLIFHVRQGGGTKTPKDKQLKVVTILDRFQNAAAVKVVAADFVDYLHLARVDGRWVIVNVLWELKPQPPQPAPAPPLPPSKK